MKPFRENAEKLAVKVRNGWFTRKGISRQYRKVYDTVEKVEKYECSI